MMEEATDISSDANLRFILGIENGDRYNNSTRKPSEDNSGVVFLVESCTFRVDKKPRVGVVGAGPAGLCAARHLIEAGLPIMVFDQGDELGGTWVYSEISGKDKYGLPVHSSLYKNLRTNLPKECMAFPDFPFPEKENSYLESQEVLTYLKEYAENFNIKPCIKLNHTVKRIAPVGEGWSLTTVDLPSDEDKVFFFDAIMVCTGPHNIPVYPQVEGMAKFSGHQLHSREFREVDHFKDKTVLIIGLGPSGLDITFMLSSVAKKVFLSHNKPKFDGYVPENVVKKTTVERLDDKQVFFSDGTVEEVDVIMYCTGYTYNYPFLTEDCFITVDQYVSPLYKHFINIEHPTMCIIGLPKMCPHMYLVDYQVRTFVNLLKEEISLPSKEEMYADLEQDIESRKEDKQRKKDYHKMWGPRSVKYFEDLSKLGNLEPIPSVQIKIFGKAFLRGIQKFHLFRDDKYKIIDNENFEFIEAV